MLSTQKVRVLELEELPHLQGPGREAFEGDVRVLDPSRAAVQEVVLHAISPVLQELALNVETDPAECRAIAERSTQRRR